MADTIRIKATSIDDEPGSILTDRVLAYHRKEKALYIGDDNNMPVKLCQADDVGKKAEKVDDVPTDAQLGGVITVVNNLISALKESGLMKKG